MTPDWRTLPPAAVLDGWVALTLTQTAYVLGLVATKGAAKGTPDRRKVLSLIEAGRLRVIDPSVANIHWTISAADLRAYIAGELAGERAA